jgi:hypothetical protein
MKTFCNIAAAGLLVASAWLYFVEGDASGAEIMGLWCIIMHMYGAKP